MNAYENRVSPTEKTPARGRSVQSDQQGEGSHQLIQQTPTIKSPPGSRNVVTHKRYMGKVKELNIVLKENDVLRMELDQLKGQLERQKEDGAKREKRMSVTIEQMNNSAKRKKMMCVGRNKLRTAEFDSFDHANTATVNKWLRFQFLPHHKFLHTSWKIYSPKRKKSFCGLIMPMLSVPENECVRVYWEQRLVGIISRCYTNWKSNINIQVKKQFYGESICIFHLCVLKNSQEHI